MLQGALKLKYSIRLDLIGRKVLGLYSFTSVAHCIWVTSLWEDCDLEWGGSLELTWSWRCHLKAACWQGSSIWAPCSSLKGVWLIIILSVTVVSKRAKCRRLWRNKAFLEEIKLTLERWMARSQVKKVEINFLTKKKVSFKFSTGKIMLYIKGTESIWV